MIHMHNINFVVVYSTLLLCYIALLLSILPCCYRYVSIRKFNLIDSTFIFKSIFLREAVDLVRQPGWKICIVLCTDPLSIPCSLKTCPLNAPCWSTLQDGKISSDITQQPHVALKLLLLLAGDVELCPGPKYNVCNKSICKNQNSGSCFIC